MQAHTDYCMVPPVVAAVEHGQVLLRDVLRDMEPVRLDELLVVC